MNKLHELLTTRGKPIDDSELRTIVHNYGFDPNNLTETDAEAIANEIAPINGLAVSNGKTSAPTKSKGRGRKSAKQVTLQDAIIHAAKQSEAELTTMESAIREHKGKYIEARSNSIVNEIRNASSEIVEGVTNKLMEETADAESFREIGNSFGENLFPSFDTAQA